MKQVQSHSYEIISLSLSLSHLLKVTKNVCKNLMLMCERGTKSIDSGKMSI